MDFHAACAARKSAVRKCSAKPHRVVDRRGKYFHIPQRLSRYLQKFRNARLVIRCDYMSPTPGLGPLMQLEARPLADICTSRSWYVCAG